MRDRSGGRNHRSMAACTAASENFVCVHCKGFVPGIAPGTEHRNHCPHCLWSRHVDIRSGDRRSPCRGEMEPVAVSVKRNGEWMLIHRCVDCGMLRGNRIAGDDAELLLMSLAVKPLASPPFPLEVLGRNSERSSG